MAPQGLCKSRNRPNARRGAPVAVLLCGLLLIAAAGVLNAPLLHRRYGMGLTAGEPLENAPPAVVFSTVVLGGFRGIVADVLWLRISYLQEEGRVFEIVQLADWVTKLEPRNTDIWAFHAWNMAYNVSVMMADNRDRWRWVRRGIELLRDDGIRLNPGDPHLYRELGWLYQHKLGMGVDPAQGFFRARLAEDVELALDGGRLDPDRLARDPAYGPRIRNALRLDPDRMLAVEAEFGWLDWRVPFSHTLYWAYSGKLRAPDQAPIEIFRMLYQAMTSLFTEGGFEWDAGHPDGFRRLARKDLLPRTRQAYRDALAALDEGRATDYGMPELLRTGIRVAYGNFLGNLVRRYMTEQREEEASVIYDELRAFLPELPLPREVAVFTERWSGPFLDEMLE